MYTSHIGKGYNNIMDSTKDATAFDLSRVSDKTKAFIKHYIVTKNGAESARLAGYAPKSARVKASQLLANPSIRKHIDNLCDWSFEEWCEKVKKVYLDNSDNWQASLKSLELYGKGKGYCKDSGLTVNAFTLSSEDVERARLAISKRLDVSRETFEIDHEAQGIVEP